MKLYPRLSLLAAILMLATAGCGEATGTKDDKSQKESNGQSDSPKDDSDKKTESDSTKWDDVEKEVSEAAKAAGQYANEEMKKYAETLDQKLADMDQQLKKLEEKGQDLAGEAKQQWEQQLAGLQEQRKEINKDLEALQGATADAWERMKNGMDAAWQDLQQSMKEAASQFE